MESGLDLHALVMALGFLLLIGMSAWHRLRLQRAVAALPDEGRERLGWIWTGEASALRHRRLFDW